jgi:LDH2 family malate/lactate/ureidoglycolate dehydrogenase
MRRCIEKARRHGFACAAIRRSGHFIAAGPYAMLAAEAGMIGFASSNVSPLMAPTGGLTRTFGTNPLAYAIPAARHFPLLFDMATSATAGHKVRMAALAGRQVAPGLIEDKQGQPTTDPQDYVDGGLILPVGGYKGYGLAMVVDALCGVLTGAGFARGASVTHGKTGQFFWALDVEQLMPRAEFLARMDEQIDQAKASARKEGVEEIMVPGERGQRRKQRLLEQGTVPLSATSWEVLAGECRTLGLELPAEVA